ncbi:MAG: RNA polymerase sigma factor [Caldilineae bacterium]|nr:RNA polymerase sigma factor [Chloroflexota bacterium]MCB9175826.1 RNA polymerase sigma factor [Caldilineae bacterium]
MALHHEQTDPQRARRFARLVDEHGLRVLRFLQGMTGDSDSAEDLAQDVFLKAWAALQDLREELSAAAWLYVIARNTAASHLAQARRRPSQPLGEAEREPADPARPADETLPLRLAVRQALDRLEARDREILLLVGLAGLSAVEVAEMMGIGVEAARKRWQRAGHRFRQAMEEAA